ncbi:MAG: hypothetical protein IT293_09740 [Deltaproteobacteria bacterium]|nr:hypothetical protein [Deltaproteobacteria bacterium]
MTTGRTRASILVAALVAVALSASSAAAQLSGDRLKCVLASAKASQKYTIGKLKVLQKCKNTHLKDGTCPMPDGGALAKLEGKLSSAIGKACALTPTDFGLMGFPGPCTDPNPGDDFTTADLQLCMQTAHDAFVAATMDLMYDATVPGPLGGDLKCQAEVAKQTIGFSSCVLKSVSKCRDALLKGKPLGVPPDYCATNDPKTSAAIQKCNDKLTAGIAKKCTNAQVSTLKVCTPDQTDAASAATCLVDQATVSLDGTEITVPPDLIDYEYAVRGGLCGDNVVNNLNEECDGIDDSVCPGQCGTPTTPDGFFACLCKTKPRMVIEEWADVGSDTDNGWTGLSADGSVVEGGGFLVDLYDCDMSGLCNAGPSCSVAPHSSCAVPDSAPSGTTSDSVCAGLGQGTCRKERTANGPHCFMDINKKCDVKKLKDPVCDAPGDFCALSPHAAPVAQVAGGIAVCNVSTISEDVVGTVNLVDGTSTLKVRQRAVTHQGITQEKPCPMCGGFCGINRRPCTVDGDCDPGFGPCINEPVCSDGARRDKACRRTAPFGGAVPPFGVTSVDCPPDTGLLTADTGIGLDINANRTTGTTTLLPSFNCTGVGWTGKACLGGTSEGRPCTVASECPGGTCTGQCFCSGQLRPNACGKACVGGANDALPCTDDSECDPPNGFCHAGDCRADPSDLDSNQEGACTNETDPHDQYCVQTPQWGCLTDAQCQPSLACPFCVAGDTCQFRKRACSVNSGIIRIGTPGTVTRETGAIYCVPSNSPTINQSAGFPGPGALIQRETIHVTP